jgi:hypothetical protein
MDLKLDLTFAEVVAEQFDDYVHTEVLFYPVGAIKGMQMPQLTIGNWLETEWRLHAVNASPDILNNTRAEVRRVRNRATELYQNKARREFKSRLDTWEMFLDEQSQRVDKDRAYNTGSGYPTQAHVRLKLALLLEDVSQLAAQLSRLRMADAKLKLRFKPGAFVWEPELQAAAPPEKWWWLYGKEGGE